MCEDDEHIDFYNHPPLGDEAANTVNDANQAALLVQIKALKLLMKTNTDPTSLATQNVQLNTLLQQFAIDRRLCFGEQPW